MNILFVSPFAPYPPDEGGRRRVFHLLEHLRQRHQVTLVTYDRGEKGATPAGLRHVRVPYTPQARQRWRRTLRLLSTMPDLAAKATRREMRAALRQELTHHTDLVWLEESPLLPNLPPTGVPVIIGEQNIESELWRASVGHDTPRARYELKRLRAFEDRAWRRAAAVAVVSDHDAAIVRARVPAAKISVIANGVETTSFTPQRNPNGPLLLVGPLGHAPNRDGLAWFLRELWPLLHARPPQPTALIAGKGSEALTGLPPGVQALGRVDDIRAVYRRGSLLLVPLLSGGGSRLKILEAWASGLPVVSTTAGAAGLREAADHLVLADNPAAFADAVQRLLTNPMKAELLAQGARQFVEQHYSWQATLAPLERLLALAAGKRA